MNGSVTKSLSILQIGTDGIVLLSPRSFNFALESEVNKELRLFRNIGAQSSGDYLTGLN